jgi:hypothetical protein
LTKGCTRRSRSNGWSWRRWGDPVHKRRDERGRLEPVPAATNLRPDLGQEQIQVRRNQPVKLQQHHTDTSGKEQVDSHHGKRHKLRRDVDEHVVRRLSSLLLGYGVCHGEDECLRQQSKIEAGQVIEYLKPESASNHERR